MPIDVVVALRFSAMPNWSKPEFPYLQRFTVQIPQAAGTRESVPPYFSPIKTAILLLAVAEY